MSIAADKIAHIKAGGLAGAFGLVVGLVLAAAMAHLLGLAGLPAAVLVLVTGGAAALMSATAAGAAKELADKADNVIHPGMHGVEVADAVATAAPGAVLCLACCSLAYLLHTGLVSWA